MSTSLIAHRDVNMLDYPMQKSQSHATFPDHSNNQMNTDYERIEKTIRFLTQHRLDQPDLKQVANEVGLSEFHFQRLFSRWVGISPKKFLQYITLSHAKQRLSNSASVLDATLDVGLSGPGRLHDLFVNFLGVSPGEYKSRGLGLEFRYAFHPSPFGECMTVTNERGLAGLSFVVNGDYTAALEEQKRGWDQAYWTYDPKAGLEAVQTIFSEGKKRDHPTSVSVLMRGTPYQVRVWEALLKIPVGCTTTYGDLAEKIGYGKKAARALGNACGANRIGILIPCHRVIRDTGVVSGYRWGIERKQALLAFEAAVAEKTDSLVL